MKLSELKNILLGLDTLSFTVENGNDIPAHFHVTEVGLITKDFIDCGGKIRHEKVINFQLWNADDVDHRLEPNKLKNIIQISEEKLGIEDLEIEVEYQNSTIGKYGLAFDRGVFVLTPTYTDCLAREICNVPEKKEVISSSSACTPGGGCC